MDSSLSIALAARLLFLTSGVAASLLLYLDTGPSWRELAASATLAAIVAVVAGLPGPLYVQATIAAAYWAAAAFACCLVIPFIRPAELRRRQLTILAMLVPPAAVVATAVGLLLNQHLTPRTLDGVLYAADASFGGQPSFAAARLLARLGFLRPIIECCYVNLPVAAVAVYLVLVRRDPDAARRYVRATALVGIAGWVCYFVMPGVGTMVMFGDRFPDAPPLLADVARFSWPTLDAPRNCMPSLHTAWGLLLCLVMPTGTTARRLTVAYTALMLTYAAASGHYLVDLIAAVPFAVAMYALAHRRPRAGAATVWLVPLAVFVGWLVLVGVGTPLLLWSPVVPWTATVATCVVSWAAYRRASTRPAREA